MSELVKRTTLECYQGLLQLRNYYVKMVKASMSVTTKSIYLKLLDKVQGEIDAYERPEREKESGF